MKRASLQIVIGFLVFRLGVVGSCVPSHRKSTPSAQPVSAAEKPAKSANTVSYKGISFTFDPSLATEVKSETNPASTDGKPSDIWPEHPAFTLVGFPRARASGENDPQISILPITQFREAVDSASKEDAKTVVYPKNLINWTTYFDEELRLLKALVGSQPQQSELKSFITRVRNYRSPVANDPQMPFLPMWEATQAFVAHVRYVNFRNGKGVFFLTQWDVSDSYQVTNDGLEYAYQGITDDGKYYVCAEFSVAAPFLPRDNDPDVAAWDEKNYLLPHNSKKYHNYVNPVIAKLEALPSDKFHPSLEILERVIASLEVKDLK